MAPDCLQPKTSNQNKLYENPSDNAPARGQRTGMFLLNFPANVGLLLRCITVLTVVWTSAEFTPTNHNKGETNTLLVVPVVSPSKFRSNDKWILY